MVRSVYTNVRQESWSKHYNAVSRLEEDVSAENSAVEERKGKVCTAHKLIILPYLFS